MVSGKGRCDDVLSGWSYKKVIFEQMTEVRKQGSHMECWEKVSQEEEKICAKLYL